MIYFDNAATTKYKPESVYEAANFYLREMGVSPGRGRLKRKFLMRYGSFSIDCGTSISITLS